MKTPDFPPAKFEVEDQLRRILESKRFRNAPNLSAFLKLVVVRAVKRQKTTERIIGETLFGKGFDPFKAPDVRVTAINLRKTLARYYEGEGCNDVVVISFATPPKDKTIKALKGEAYTPLFNYNPRHDTYIGIRLAFRCLEQSTYRECERAFRLFGDVLSQDRDNVAAGVGMVETLCAFTDRNWEYPVEIVPYPAFMNFLVRLEEHANNYWRFWAAKAYFHHLFGEDELTVSCYAKALKLDRISTESFLPFIDYLIATDRTDLGLGLAQRYVNERVEDATAIAHYGRLLIFAGKPDIGVGHLLAALAIEPGNCLAHESLAIARLAQRDRVSFLGHLQTLKLLCDTQTFDCIVASLKGFEDRHKLGSFMPDISTLGSTGAS